MWHDVTVIRKKTHAQARVDSVPPEEFGIERRARSVQSAAYCFHETVKREGDLIEDGYDPEQIKSLPTSLTTNIIEALARDTVNESYGFASDIFPNRAARPILITEHYCRMDYEGNGKPALYRITTGGQQSDILKRGKDYDIVEVDFIPFAAQTPVPVPHRFFGRSLADLIMDLQRIKTALIRGMLDNTYLAVNPRPEVAAAGSTETTLEDLLTSRPGAPIRVKQSGTITWQEMPSIAQNILPVLQYVDAEREWRTGATRIGQGVDPNAIQNQVATIANQQYAAAQAKTKLIARIFAETGMRDMFWLLHRVVRQHGEKPQTVRLRNKWATVNPREWKERDNLAINVGLGTGSKQEQVQNLTMLAGMQQQAVHLGMVSKKNFYNTADHITTAMGFKDTETFFIDPSVPPNPQDQASQPVPAPPDPKQKESESKLQIAQLQAQSSQQELQQKAQLEQQKVQVDAAHQKMRMDMEMALEQQKFALERELKVLDAQLKAQVAEHQMQIKTRESEHAIAQNTQNNDNLSKMHREHMDATAQIVKHITAPRKIVRGKDGKISHAESVIQ